MKTTTARRVKDNLAAYAFLTAGIVVFAVFSWYPMVRGIIMSFQVDNFVTDPQWVGLDNYRTMFADPLFGIAWRNTLEFTVLALLFGAVVPFGIAVLINEFRRFQGYFRVTAYMPVMLPPIVVALLWKWFFTPDSGLFNTVLRALHLPTPDWIYSAHTSMISLVLVATWSNLGGAVIIYLAGLQSIPGELYEAAELDGASIRQRLRHVTVPQLRFVILVLLLLQIIATMQVFVEPFALTGGGPDNSTVTVMLLIYRYAFVFGDFGAATAMSSLLFVVLGAFAAGYLRLTRGTA